MKFVDSHCHLDVSAFDADRDELIEKIFQTDISSIINIGATDGLEGARRSVVLAEKYPQIYFSVGIHPHDSAQDLDFSELRDRCQHPKVLAIGETGLDFFYDFSPREKQEAAFRYQIELAIEVKKPLVIHSRNAGNDCLEILQEYATELSERGGVFHCFGESADFAAKLRELHFLVSYPGILSFPKANELREAAKAIPLSQVMLETDAPYLAPLPFRGKRCDSSMIPYTAEVLSRILDIPLSEVAEQTTANARKFFGVPTL